MVDIHKEKALDFQGGLEKWYECVSQSCDHYAEDKEIIGRQLETRMLKKIIEAVREGKVVVVGTDGNGACLLYGICQNRTEAQIFFGNEDHRVFLATADNNTPVSPKGASHIPTRIRGRSRS